VRLLLDFMAERCQRLIRDALERRSPDVPADTTAKKPQHA
jgi:hypothetical protein